MARMKSIENLVLKQNIDPNSPTFVVNDWSQITIVKTSTGDAFVGVNGVQDVMQLPPDGLQFIAEPGTQIWIYSSTGSVDIVFMVQTLPFINQVISLLQTLASARAGSPVSKAAIPKGGC